VQLEKYLTVPYVIFETQRFSQARHVLFGKAITKHGKEWKDLFFDGGSRWLYLQGKKSMLCSTSIASSSGHKGLQELC